MDKFVLKGNVISGSNVGDKVFIPRLSPSPSDVKILFKFQIRQFPIVVSFAMTITNETYNIVYEEVFQNMRVWLNIIHGDLIISNISYFSM